MCEPFSGVPDRFRAVIEHPQIAPIIDAILDAMHDQHAAIERGEPAAAVVHGANLRYAIAALNRTVFELWPNIEESQAIRTVLGRALCRVNDRYTFALGIVEELGAGHLLPWQGFAPTVAELN